MTKLKTKLMTIFVTLMVLSLSVTLPVMAAKPSVGYWCDTYTGGVCDEGAFPEGYVKLTGSDEHKAIAQARTDDDVKALKKEIMADGYTPLGNGEIAGTMDINGTEVLMVTFFFKPKNGNGNETAEITYLYNTETGDTAVIRTAGCFWQDVICVGAVIGTFGSVGVCAVVCLGTVGTGCIPCLVVALGADLVMLGSCMQAVCCHNPSDPLCDW